MTKEMCCQFRLNQTSSPGNRVYSPRDTSRFRATGVD